MVSRELQALWARIEADLRRARSFLPADADSDPVVREYQEFLEHNEFELACNTLEQLAEERRLEPAFWLALRDAAAKMSLQERAAQYETRASRP